MHNMLLCSSGLSFVALQAGSDKLHFLTFYKLPAFCVLIFYICKIGSVWWLCRCSLYFSYYRLLQWQYNCIFKTSVSWTCV